MPLFRFRSRIALISVVSILLVVGGILLSPAQASHQVQPSRPITGNAVHAGSAGPFAIDPLGSWNPFVQCSNPPIVRITDITNNSTETTSYNTSPFSPGITENPFVSGSAGAKRWLTPGPSPPPTPGWVSPGPTCTVTNLQGQVIAAFVEIHGVKTNYSAYVDCSTNYDAVNGGSSMPPGHWCDQDFNIYDPAGIPNYASYKASCTTASDPTCFYRMGSEFDHDWAAKGYVGPSTGWANNNTMKQDFLSNSETLFDVQGFVFWDNGHVFAQGHSFSGWELHAFTAWRLSQSSQSLTAGFSYTPSSPQPGQTVSFTGSATGGSPPYSFSWSFGDGASATGNPVSHSYSAAGSYTATLRVTDSTSASVSSTQIITVTGPADFTIGATPNSFTLTAGTSGGSTVTLTSSDGFAGTVGLTATVSPPGPTTSLNPTTVGLSPGGSTTSELTISTTASTPPSYYSVTVTGASGSLSHSVTVTITVAVANVPDFSIGASPSSLNLKNGQSGSSTVTIIGVNGFSGTVSLSATVSPAGPGLSFSSTSVTIDPGGSGSSVLTIGVGGLAAGKYTITVTGTSGQLSHSVIIVVTIKHHH